MKDSDTIVIRACLGSTVVLFGAFLIPTVLATIAALEEPGFVGISIGCWLILVAYFVWLKSLRISIENGTLSYQSIFGKVKNLRLSDIESARIEVGYRRYTDRFRAPFRLVIRPTKTVGISTVTINLKLFGKSEVQELLDLLGVE